LLGTVVKSERTARKQKGKGKKRGKKSGHEELTKIVIHHAENLRKVRYSDRRTLESPSIKLSKGKNRQTSEVRKRVQVKIFGAGSQKEAIRPNPGV